MSEVRFGIIGCGGAAVPVAEAIHALPNTTLTLTYDANTELARDLAGRFSSTFVTDLDTLLASPEVDAVYVAVPHYLLAGLAKQVLNAGKHALVEKPMALNMADAEDLIALAESKKLALGVFYELRSSAAFLNAREIVQQGALGEIIGIQVRTVIDKPMSYWQRGYAGRWVNSWRGEQAKAGGGVVLMNASHFLDGMMFATGLGVTRVQAETDTHVAQVEVEDIAAATFRLSNGAVGSLFAGAHLAGAGADETIMLYGAKGTLHTGDPYHGTSYQIFLRESWNGLAANTWHTLPFATTNPYEGAAAAFAEAVRRGEPAPVGGVDARRVLRIVLGMYQSAREARVIEIDSPASS